jgi:TonB family protein
MTSNRLTLKVVSLIVLFSSTLVAVSAQSSPQSEWIRLISQAEDFSVELPSSDYLVWQRPGGGYEIWFDRKGLSLNIEFYDGGDPKRQIAEWASRRDDRDFKNFTSGDFIGRWYSKPTTDGLKRMAVFQIASTKGLYVIYAANTPDNVDVCDRFLRSIRLANKQIVDVSGTDPEPSQSVSVKRLESSSIIKEALKRPARTDLKFDKSFVNMIVPPPPPRVVSRSLIILSRPKASYTDDARQHNIKGSVTLSIVFQADGQIGAIRLLKSLDKGLDRNAFEAARQIKFLPALVDGVPVETVATFDYGFDIY